MSIKGGAGTHRTPTTPCTRLEVARNGQLTWPHFPEHEIWCRNTREMSQSETGELGVAEQCQRFPEFEN